MSRSRYTSMFTASSSKPKVMLEVFPEGCDGGLPATSRIWEEGIKWHVGAYTAAWATPKLMVVYECIRTHVSHNNNNPLYDRGFYWRRSVPSPPPEPDAYPSSSSCPATPTRRTHSSSVPMTKPVVALPKAYATASVPLFGSSAPDTYTALKDSPSDQTRFASSEPPSPNYQLQAEPALFATEPRGGVAACVPTSASTHHGRSQGLGSEAFPPAQANYGYV